MMLRLFKIASMMALVLTSANAAPVNTTEIMTKADLQSFNVTVRVFNPKIGIESGQDYVLSVDSPDAEHATASTMANAISFTKKIEDGKAMSIAFMCIKVEAR